MLSHSTRECLFAVVVGLAAGYFIFQNDNKKGLASVENPRACAGCLSFHCLTSVEGDAWIFRNGFVLNIM